MGMRLCFSQYPQGHVCISTFVILISALPFMPQVVHNGVLFEAEHPVMGRILGCRPPVQFSGAPFVLRHLAPELGEHTREVRSPFPLPACSQTSVFLSVIAILSFALRHFLHITRYETICQPMVSGWLVGWLVDWETKKMANVQNVLCPLHQNRHFDPMTLH